MMNLIYVKNFDIFSPARQYNSFKLSISIYSLETKTITKKSLIKSAMSQLLSYIFFKILLEFVLRLRKVGWQYFILNILSWEIILIRFPPTEVCEDKWIASW